MNVTIIRCYMYMHQLVQQIAVVTGIDCSIVLLIVVLMWSFCMLYVVCVVAL